MSKVITFTLTDSASARIEQLFCLEYGYEDTVLNPNYDPVKTLQTIDQDNPDYDPEQPISETNNPYITIPNPDYDPEMKQNIPNPESRWDFAAKMIVQHVVKPKSIQLAKKYAALQAQKQAQEDISLIEVG